MTQFKHSQLKQSFQKNLNARKAIFGFFSLFFFTFLVPCRRKEVKGTRRKYVVTIGFTVTPSQAAYLNGAKVNILHSFQVMGRAPPA